MKIPRRILLAALLTASLGAWLLLLALAQRYEEPPNYSQIEDGLYQGGDVLRPPPGTQAVLNLCRTEDPYHCAVHRWEPIRDSAPAPDVAWLRRMVEFVAEQRQAGRPTYVHCRAGVSRSGLVVMAYLMAKNGWTRDEALAFVRSKRPSTRPNPAFLELLSEWEQERKASTGRKDQ